MATYCATAWEEVFSAVRAQFEIDNLFPEQELAIKPLRKKKGFCEYTHGLR